MAAVAPRASVTAEESADAALATLAACCAVAPGAAATEPAGASGVAAIA